MLRVLILLTFLTVTTGCYTFQVPSAIDDIQIEALEPSDHSIVLVMDREYREFESTDKGHSLADPQTYVIGPGLSELTSAYFRRAFTTVTVAQQAASVPSGSAIIVETQVAEFENEISMSPTKQSLTIELGASVSSADGTAIGSAHGIGSSTHAVDFLRDSEDRIASILGVAIQEALVQLITEISEHIEKHTSP